MVRTQNGTQITLTSGETKFFPTKDTKKAVKMLRKIDPYTGIASVKKVCNTYTMEDDFFFTHATLENSVEETEN